MPALIDPAQVKLHLGERSITDDPTGVDQECRAAEVALVRACLRNDAAALRRFIETYQADVYGLCVRILGDAHEAEDVAQEVFLRVLRGLRGWDSQRPLKPWIMAAALNRCRTFLAKRVRRPQFFAMVPEPTPVPVVESDHELSEAIGQAVDDLREDYREVFVQFHEQGRSYEMISNAMRRSVGTIKTWLHRARVQVLKRLRDRGLLNGEGA